MKPLILFYSHSGNTRQVGQTIAKLTGGEYCEVVPVQPYPTDYNTVVEQAKREIQAGFLPEIQALTTNVSAYDTLIVGTPNWWSTMAPPVATFLQQNDLTDKTIIPFCTHGGGGLARIGRDIAKACSNSKAGDAFEVYGNGGNALEEKLCTWLAAQGILTQK